MYGEILLSFPFYLFSVDKVVSFRLLQTRAYCSCTAVSTNRFYAEKYTGQIAENCLLKVYFPDEESSQILNESMFKQR